jgi:general secretion pathway protein G
VKSRRIHRGAFTLLEVLLVIAILGVLAAAVGFTIGGTGTQANVDTTRTLVTKIVPDAVERYRFNTKNLPNTLEDLIRDPGVAGWAGPYLQTSQLNDAWGRPLVFQPSGSTFVVFSYGNDGVQSADDLYSNQ